MMHRILGLLLALAVGSAVAGDTPPTNPAQPAGLEIVDLTDDFARIWDETAALPDAERVAAFKSGFAAILPGFYDHARFRTQTAAQYDERLLKRLKQYPEQREEIARVSREFQAMVEPAQKSFEAQFGPMTGFPPVYLVNSLGEFDGGTRDLKDGNRLLFGADVIAKIHKPGTTRPFVHHELFHLYHRRHVKEECEPIWCGLWAEGLATYVATKLNPGATDAQLLLTFPEPLRPAVEKNRSAAVCAVRDRLDSTRPEDYSALFSNGRLNADLPSRFGYYVGLLVAEDLGKSRSLDQLARLPLTELRPLIADSLDRLGNCPAAVA